MKVGTKLDLHIVLNNLTKTHYVDEVIIINVNKVTK